MQIQLLEEQIQELYKQLAESKKCNQQLLKKQAGLGAIIKNNSGAPVKLLNVRNHPEANLITNPTNAYDSIFQQLFRKSAEAMLIMLPEGAILSANSAVCTLLKYSEAELLQKAITRLLIKTMHNKRYFSKKVCGQETSEAN